MPATTNKTMSRIKMIGTTITAAAAAHVKNAPFQQHAHSQQPEICIGTAIFMGMGIRCEWELISGF